MTMMTMNEDVGGYSWRRVGNDRRDSEERDRAVYTMKLIRLGL